MDVTWRWICTACVAIKKKTDPFYLNFCGEHEPAGFSHKENPTARDRNRFSAHPKEFF
jgi:hypothetical protein